jgi:hypothetical protein
MITVDLSEAAIGGIGTTGPLLNVISGAINRALGDASLGVAVDVSTDSGMINIGLAM